MTPPERPTAGTSALIDLREQDAAAGVDPRAPTKVVELAPAAPPGPSIHELLAADPPDWHQEERARQAAEREREQQERTRIVEEELRRIPAEDEQTRPAPKRRRWHV